VIPRGGLPLVAPIGAPIYYANAPEGPGEAEADL